MRKQQLIKNSIIIIYKMKVKEEQKRFKEVSTRNQERCLNSQPFSRQRAYLNKQKCQKNIVNLKQLETCLHQPKNTVKKEEQFGTQQLMGLTSNIDQFDSGKIQRQMSALQSMMDKIETSKDARTNIANHNFKNNIKKPSKVKTSHSTRTDSLHSPKSIDLGEYWNKNKFKTEEVDKVLEKEEALDKKMSEGKNRSSFVKDIKNKMVKVKSSRNVLKVYNPFPSPMAEMF